MHKEDIVPIRLREGARNLSELGHACFTSIMRLSGGYKASRKCIAAVSKTVLTFRGQVRFAWPGARRPFVDGVCDRFRRRKSECAAASLFVASPLLSATHAPNHPTTHALPPPTHRRTRFLDLPRFFSQPARLTVKS
eukprot:2993345-Pleurochrysis_carterae.AAC.2